MLLAKLIRYLVELRECCIGIAAVAVQLCLMAMSIVGKLPISIIVLRRQTVCIHGSMHCPGMDFGQREILINDLHLIAVALQDVGKEHLMHTRAEWALEVVV